MFAGLNVHDDGVLIWFSGGVILWLPNQWETIGTFSKIRERTKAQMGENVVPPVNWGASLFPEVTEK